MLPKSNLAHQELKAHLDLCIVIRRKHHNAWHARQDGPEVSQKCPEEWHNSAAADVQGSRHSISIL